jgi:hypothetical protein
VYHNAHSMKKNKDFSIILKLKRPYLRPHQFVIEFVGFSRLKNEARGRNNFTNIIFWINGDRINMIKVFLFESSVILKSEFLIKIDDKVRRYHCNQLNLLFSTVLSVFNNFYDMCVFNYWRLSSYISLFVNTICRQPFFFKMAAFGFKILKKKNYTRILLDARADLKIG